MQLLSLLLRGGRNLGELLANQANGRTAYPFVVVKPTVLSPASTAADKRIAEVGQILGRGLIPLFGRKSRPSSATYSRELQCSGYRATCRPARAGKRT
jgi:hypothetical protein